MSIIAASPNTLEGAKKIALLIIDQRAEEARLRYITPGNGQTQVYLEKAEEASDFIATGALDKLNNYPYIAAESEVTGRDPVDVAEDIINARVNWVKISAEIERLRMRAKQKFHQSNSVSDIQDTCQQIVEELDRI